MRKELKYCAPVAIMVFILVFTISCVPVRNLKYLNDIDNLQGPIVMPRKQSIILPFDRLSIRVLSIDEKTNQLFNSNTSIQVEYVVDVAGNINFPFIGVININGLSPEQAGTKLGKALSEYFSDATVIVNFTDSKVTILGQVQTQGVFSFGKDKLNIYEAMALGNGISQYGDRKNVVLIRQEGDKLMHYKLDLSNARIAEKDYYYIQSNDVIIVEPLKSASWYTFNSSSFSIFLSTFTSLLLIYTYFLRK